VVEPLTVLLAVNDSNWQVRIVPTVLHKIREELNRTSPQETGGVFIGRASFKTKTIHVVDLVLAPPDSQANQVCFFRGIQGLPEQVAAVTEATGGQLGYIGEWHTHPQGPECMSQTDAEAVRRFKQEFQALTSPLPVFLLIATPTTFLPFVY
jgi:proteasome lid subunit RPN8/RPN11